MAVRVQPVIQSYAWGSPTVLPDLLGVAATGEPQAELWLGAHPGGPAGVGAGRTLADVVAADPERALGATVAERYGGRLPFLLKVLAAARPLSLQAHPTRDQAAAGFAREEAAGVPADDARRIYKDDNHKPEMLCALTPFTALCGFREPAATVTLLSGLRVADLDPIVAAVATGAAGLRQAVGEVLGAGDPRLVSAVVEACAANRGDPVFRAERRWATRLAEQYPGDPGVVVALLLNLVTLAPREAIELRAGNLHMYLDGTGVEIMASSDNVLRGGLTPKHVDVRELIAVLDTTPVAVTPLRPRTVARGLETWDSEAAEYRLSRVTVQAGEPAVALAPTGPEIVLTVTGTVTLTADGTDPLPLGQGQAAFVPAADGPYTATGDGTAYRATVGAA